MSTSKKKRMENDKNSKKKRMEASSSEESSDEEEYTGNEVNIVNTLSDAQNTWQRKRQIQVDFEGRSPEEGDFHGVKQLLRQLFLKTSIDLSQISDILIKQTSIGSVVKQCDDNPDSDDDDEVDQDDVYGITSVVSLQDKEHLQCTKQLKSYLLQKCSAHAPEDVKARITEVLEKGNLQTGLLLNERFVNIPPQISVPLLQNLSKEIKKSVEKKSLPNFDYYILICKLYKMKAEKTKKGKKSTSEISCIWSNPEEEMIAELAECSFEFSVKGDADTGLGGTWKDTDSDMEPWRMVLLLPAKSLEAVIEKIVQNLS